MFRPPRKYTKEEGYIPLFLPFAQLNASEESDEQIFSLCSSLWPKNTREKNGARVLCVVGRNWEEENSNEG